MARRTIKCCKDCPDRYIGCHAKCERYIREKKELEEYLEEYRRIKRLQQEVDSCVIDNICETIRRMAKHK